MRVPKIPLFVVCLMLFSSVYADGKGESGKYRIPLDLPVSLSGSYGELRSTHFHTGLDFRIGGVSGAHLYAAASGYISRISVAPGGYGNAIYISHPDGNTTIYGHMLDFPDNIATWVRENQYKKESFDVVLLPDSLMFPVKKGDFIGRAGNTGSSGGPHLHFEMRDTKSGQTLNPIITAGYDILDELPPEFREISFYSIRNLEVAPERKLIASFKSNSSKTLQVPDSFYVAVAGIDRQNNTGAKLAVFQYNYYLDDTLVFSFTPDRIAPGMGRYINSIVEYPRKYKDNLSLVKSWVEPGCGIKSNIDSKNEGVFVIKDDLEHVVKVELIDEHGNRSYRKFIVVRSNVQPGSTTDSTSIVMPWYLPNRHQGENAKVFLPAGVLYSSIRFDAGWIEVDGTNFYKVHEESTPVHTPFLLALKADNHIDSTLRAKMLLVRLGKNGNRIPAGGEYLNGWVESRVSSFGSYSISLDTIPPVIVPAFYERQNLSGRNYLRFAVYDDLSGISDYQVRIDGKWVLTSYDPKFKRLQTELKQDVLDKGKTHELVIFVKDNKGNVNTLKRSFLW